jgi:hypothetical protein
MGAGAPRRTGQVLQCPDALMGALRGRTAMPGLRAGLGAVSAWKGYTRKDGTRKRHFYYACATGRRSGKEACS